MKRTGDIRESGTTAIEVVTSVVIFAAIMVGFSGSLDGTARFMGQQQGKETLAQRGNVAMDRLSQLIRGTRSEDLIPDPFGISALPDGAVTEIQFQRTSGVNADLALEMKEAVLLKWRLAPGEAKDGIDNNGNLLVDEGDLVMITPDGRVGHIASNVPDQGLKLYDTGDGFIRISLEVVLPPSKKGEVARRRTFKTKVPLK